MSSIETRKIHLNRMWLILKFFRTRNWLNGRQILYLLFQDDIALLVCMISILLFTVIIVLTKVSKHSRIHFHQRQYYRSTSLTRPPTPTSPPSGPCRRWSTTIRSTMVMGIFLAMGLSPAKYVWLYEGIIIILVTQPDHMAPWQLEERLEHAMPCHDYLGKGEGPEGCWWANLRVISLEYVPVIF